MRGFVDRSEHKGGIPERLVFAPGVFDVGLAAGTDLVGFVVQGVFLVVVLVVVFGRIERGSRHDFGHDRLLELPRFSQLLF